MFSAFNLASQFRQLLSNYGVQMEGRSHTTGARFMKLSKCLWNVRVKSENYRSRNIRDKALEEMAKQLNIPGLTQQDVKLKFISIRSRYSSEQAKVLQSEKSGVGRDDIYVPKLFWFKQADLFLSSVDSGIDCLVHFCGTV